MLYGCGTMAVLNVCLGITGSVGASSAAQKAALAMTCLWVITYALTAAPVGFVIAAEVGSARLRAQTTGFAIGVYGALNLIFTFTIPLFLDPNGTNWGTKAAYVGFSSLSVPFRFLTGNRWQLFGGLSAIATVLLYFYLPEVSLFHRSLTLLTHMLSADCRTHLR